LKAGAAGVDLMVWVNAAHLEPDRPAESTMRLIPSGIASVIALVVAMPAQSQDKPAGPDIEGKWLIVYVEEGGKRNATWEQQVATVKGDTMTYSKEGDDRSLKLAFGADQTVKAKGSIGKDNKSSIDLSGVYISSQDYLCLSMNPDKAEQKGDGKKSSAAFIIILRKQR
jgi:hypothetical protein